MLSPDTRLGQVHINVSNIERSLLFYQTALGFKLHSRVGNKGTVGTGEKEIVVLTEQPGAIKHPHRTGLYHFAILVPSRQELAHSLRNLVNSDTNLSGGADHLVSEALYLDDPDGNGIEIYRDRPRSSWRSKDGQLIMGTEPLDYQGLLAELDDSDDSWTGLHPETALGHMHLHVSYLEEATTFYQDVIGLDLMVALWGSASFLSVGGYHHHLGLNVWNGVGASPPPGNSIGLRYFTVQVPDKKELDKLIQRLERGLWPAEEHELGILVEDPSKNGIVFTVMD
jgi:catechol 2,3-dioxygenase